MIKKIFLIILLLVGIGIQAQNKNAKTTMEVDGVCLMCKARIEKVSLKTKGVKSAVWNIETHILSLIYDERKTDYKTIQTNIAKAGHDTEDIKATKEAYNSVDDCCRYRDEKVIDDHKKKDGGSHN
jgi:cation transport ATPase